MRNHIFDSYMFCLQIHQELQKIQWRKLLELRAGLNFGVSCYDVFAFLTERAPNIINAEPAIHHGTTYIHAGSPDGPSLADPNNDMKNKIIPATIYAYPFFAPTTCRLFGFF